VLGADSEPFRTGVGTGVGTGVTNSPGGDLMGLSAKTGSFCRDRPDCSIGDAMRISPRTNPSCCIRFDGPCRESIPASIDEDLFSHGVVLDESLSASTSVIESLRHGGLVEENSLATESCTHGGREGVSDIVSIGGSYFKLGGLGATGTPAW
jgi:hypothetical protein